MCAYNEEKTVARAISEVLGAHYPCDMELVVVDDGSADATPEILAGINDPRVVIHRHPENQGKGAALLSAVSIASGTHMLPFDADLEYSADDITRIILRACIVNDQHRVAGRRGTNGSDGIQEVRRKAVTHHYMQDPRSAYFLRIAHPLPPAAGGCPRSRSAYGQF